MDKLILAALATLTLTAHLNTAFAQDLCAPEETVYWYDRSDSYGRSPDLEDALTGCSAELGREITERQELCEAQYPGATLRVSSDQCLEDNCSYYGWPVHAYTCWSRSRFACCR